MLKRIASTGVNLVVLGVSVAVFLVAFFMLNALSTAQRPPTVQVLSTTRDLNIGDVISSDSLEAKTVFDDNSNLYITADEVEGVAGGIVAQPILSGQPVFRTAILAPAAEGTRLSAALAEYPGHSLFPLPLDAMNVVAPDLAAFLPGDLVGVTVVIAARPQQFSTPTPMPELLLPADTVLEPTITPDSGESAIADAQSRSFPPLAKDLFPMGVRVIAVQGLPPATDSTDDGSSSFTTFDQPQMLILLVPNAAREVLSLALQQGDRLVISLMARGEDDPTAGFTYWDFEDLFKADREEVLKGGQ
jgi:Flp pilus assembly protein CpaB